MIKRYTYANTMLQTCLAQKFPIYKCITQLVWFNLVNSQYIRFIEWTYWYLFHYFQIYLLKHAHCGRDKQKRTNHHFEKRMVAYAPKGRGKTKKQPVIDHENWHLIFKAKYIKIQYSKIRCLLLLFLNKITNLLGRPQLKVGSFAPAVTSGESW